MKYSLVLLIALALTGAASAQSASPSPATTAPAATDEDARYREAYEKNPKDPAALYDHTFSLIRLGKYADARKVLGEWRAVAPQDMRNSEVGTLIDRLEKTAPSKRDQVAHEWALEQRAAAEKEIQQIQENMRKVGEGLANSTSAAASRTATDVPRLKEAAAKDGSAASWLALSEAQVAANDFKGALESAEKALAKDPGDVGAVAAVTHLKRFDGKNGDEIRQALQKERLNQLLKTLDR
jgi:predicted Zn-dependent protease